MQENAMIGCAQCSIKVPNLPVALLVRPETTVLGSPPVEGLLGGYDHLRLPELVDDFSAVCLFLSVSHPPFCPEY